MNTSRDIATAFIRMGEMIRAFIVALAIDEAYAKDMDPYLAAIDAKRELGR